MTERDLDRFRGEALAALGIDPVRRPQTLSVAELVAIANHLAGESP